MKDDEIQVWGIHAGKTGDAHSLFLNKKCIAIGWDRMGDLRELKKDRESFKSKIAQVYPEHKTGSFPISAGQMFRFLFELKVGDIVVYPSKSDRHIHIGYVKGDYKYDPKQSPGYPHLREVDWKSSLPRTHFSQGALYEIGSAMSFFLIKTYSDEFKTALEGKSAPQPIQKDETVEQVGATTEQNTRDFILKKLSQDLKGHPFEEFIAHLLGTMGYKTRRIAEAGSDGGVDIIAHKDALGLEPPIIKVQVKSTEGTISDGAVKSLIGNISTNGEYGLFITLGSFSNPAVVNARNKSNLRIIDGDELIDLILQHYEKFDSKYKGLIPLKRVYVPETIEDLED